MKKNTVQIVRSESGAFINKSANSDKAWMRLKSVSQTLSFDGWVNETKVSTLIKGAPEQLEAIIQTYADAQGFLPGRIAVVEMVESDLHNEPQYERFQKLLDKTKTYEEAVSKFVKRAGADGPELTSNGERILRFTYYDMQGASTDLTVAHDNVDAVKAFRTVSARQSAEFPA